MSKTKIMIGKGTLNKFKEDYNLLNEEKDIIVKASQLFPQDMGNKMSNIEFTMNYEYIIYYQVSIFKKPESIQEPKAPEVKTQPRKLIM